MTADNRYLFLRVVATLSLVLSTGATAAPTSQPSDSPKTFQSTTAGIKFNYPAEWSSAKAATAIFDIIQPANSSGNASMCLDVPGLPPAIFCRLIGPKMVENGYIKDLRKNQIHDAKVDESVEVTIPSSKARRVKCSGHEDGKIAIDVAVLIVHADRVYIFSCDSDDRGYPMARKTLDDAVATVQWIK
jgi:hypothetical protein